MVMLIVVVQTAVNVRTVVGVRQNHHRLAASGGVDGGIGGWRKRQYWSQWWCWPWW